MDFSADAAGMFWRPGHGAVHYGFASPDPDARAGYVRRAAGAAARTLWTETWTNSPVLHLDPRAGLHADAAVLVGLALEVSGARRGASWDMRGAGPARLPVLALPGGLGGQRPGIYELLRTGRHMGISVTLVLPSLDLSVIDSASRELLAGVGPDRSPAGRAADPA